VSAVAYAIASDDTRYVMISTMQNSQPGLELYHVRDDVVAFDDDFAPLAGLQLNASTDSVVTMPLLAVSGACTRSVHGGVCVLNMGMGVYVYMCEPCVRVHVCVCFACACVCVCMRVCVCVRMCCATCSSTPLTLLVCYLCSPRSQHSSNEHCTGRRSESLCHQRRR